MFSGKSEELIRRLRRAQIARRRSRSSSRDRHRYCDDHIVSHSEMRIASRAVAGSRQLLERVAPTPKSSASTRAVLRRRAARGAHARRRGKRVIVAGLDQDYLGKPFEPMPQLLAIAEYITKTHRDLHGVRQPRQSHPAARGQRRRVLVGAHGLYEARCRRCFDPLLTRTRAADERRQCRRATASPARDSKANV
jgi:thymidine kinase